MLGNIGNLFVKCIGQVTKGHLYHLLGVSDYYIYCIGRGPSEFCETSANVTNWVSNPFRCLCEHWGPRQLNFDITPYVTFHAYSCQGMLESKY